MSSVFVASQSNCFLLRSRVLIRLVKRNTARAFENEPSPPILKLLRITCLVRDIFFYFQSKSSRLASACLMLDMYTQTDTNAEISLVSWNTMRKNYNIFALQDSECGCWRMEKSRTIWIRNTKCVLKYELLLFKLFYSFPYVNCRAENSPCNQPLTRNRGEKLKTKSLDS